MSSVCLSFWQADTGLELGHTAIAGSPPLATVSVAQSKGAAGECGTQCTTHPGCKSWTYTVSCMALSFCCASTVFRSKTVPFRVISLDQVTGGKCELYAVELEAAAKTAGAKGSTSGRSAVLSAPVRFIA
eukprot:SAG22_NODE_250_length_13779_cov_6.413450_11_plen_130_part_00